MVSSAIGLLQYFGVAGTFSPWVNQTNFGEAFANLRQGNQFATLTNMALAALVWVNFYSQPTSGLARPNRYAWVMAAAGLSIGFHAKPAVVDKAMLSITHGGMDRALALLQA